MVARSIEAGADPRRDRRRRERGDDLVALLLFVALATWVFWVLPA